MNTIDTAKHWLLADYDEETRKEVEQMIDENSSELTDAFYKNLEFGTGGLRGIMGVGSNRMNKYTVAMATQGFANYILASKAKNQEPRLFGTNNYPSAKVAVAFDSRNNSKFFAEITAKVFAANGIKVYLFENLRPTPELSFAVRHLHCNAGVMITASHNPKEYNGYNAYVNDGAQLIAPHDKNVITEVEKIKLFKDVKISGNEEFIQLISKEVDDIYRENVLSLMLSPEAVKKQKNLKIVYTPLHGTGITQVPDILKQAGFEMVKIVENQAEKLGNGDFPTVKSPNPEERATMQPAIDCAKEYGADLVLATDPDADRVGVAIRKNDGEYMLLNGNQTGAILIYYLMKKYQENNLFTGKDYIVKTIVTSELLKDIALKNAVECFDVLTGFKYIADIIAKNEGKKHFIGGGEESYGYLVGDFVRDKDAMIACLVVAEMAAWAAEQGKTFFDILIDLYVEYGFYKENLVSVTKKGKEGLEEIAQMMIDFRNTPPKEIAGQQVMKIIDYKKTKETALPPSDVLQFFTEDGSKITVRPSGTEPKIKFYVSVKSILPNEADYGKIDKLLSEKIEVVMKSIVSSN
ncbi:MAG: phospho-sugar mutase [Bacteroidales bacterium]|jgi:phosphoglucomutase|nr:phospho-sugar mutase [Bacteroidales bacterium]